MKTNSDGLFLIECLEDKYDPAESKAVAERWLNSNIKVPVNPYQFSALVPLVMSEGIEKVKKTKILKYLNDPKSLHKIVDIFMGFIYAENDKGKRIADPFLIEQRKRELDVFRTPYIMEKRVRK